MAMTLVSTVTVGSGGAASISFTGIANTGKDLLLLVSARTNNNESVIVTVNSDTTSANYARKIMIGSGSTVSSFGNDYRPVAVGSTTSQTSNTFGNSSVYISNYTASQHKSISIDGVSENNATAAQQRIEANLWENNAAITSLTLEAESGTLQQHSTASLYLVS
jgi:hypothetical protein